MDAKKQPTTRCSKRAAKTSRRKPDVVNGAAAVASEEIVREGAATAGISAAAELPARFRAVREFSTELCQPLKPEDCVVQSMPDVSPTKWHLAHTSWFFETFVLKPWVPAYRSEVPEYAYLFNSYYNAAGDMHRRDLRGLISRPTVEETYRFRRTIDESIAELLGSADEETLAAIAIVMTLGIHHEQQHQELLVTDIKHVFAQNPLHPVYAPRKSSEGRAPSLPREFVEFDEAVIEIGHESSNFSDDNEGPLHRALFLPFALATRPITNAEYIEFIEDGGYTRAEFWLSLGWTTLRDPAAAGWNAPLYWTKNDGAWWNFTLSGFRP